MTGPTSACVQALDPNAQPAASLRVLLADDSQVLRYVTCRLLATWGIVPVLARNGAEAVALAAEQDFDLILMDIQMPIMDGLTATLRIRNQERVGCSGRVPVVAYTSCDSTWDKEALSRSGMDAQLQKPCNAAAMENCLNRLCPRKFPE